MQREPSIPQLKENHITYEKQEMKGETVHFVSLPWSYLLAGLALFIVGILDYNLLGNLIGHPEHPTTGEYIGQGIAVFLGGVSFFYTVGLIPLIVGIFMLIYCLFSMKKIEIANNGSLCKIQERKLVFPTFSEINLPDINQIKYTNTGLKFKHTWILLFIPMAVRILQFGIPLFGEPLAQDEILPTMMVITALIDILVAIFILLYPNHQLTFDSEWKKYILNFFPMKKNQEISEEVCKLLDLYIDPSETEENLWEVFRNQNDSKGGKQGKQRNYFRIIFSMIVLIASIIGTSAEFLWGTDLSMVGLTFGAYVLLQAFQNDLSEETLVTIDQHQKKSKYRVKNGRYWTSIRFCDIDLKNGLWRKTQFRSVNFTDILGMGLLVYLSTLEFLWSWRFLNIFNGLILVDLILTTIMWGVIICGCFIYLLIPLNYLVFNYGNSQDSYQIYPPTTKFISVGDFHTLKKSLFLPSLKKESIFRIFGFAIIVLLTLITAIF
ncbi:hypothetical protein NEF87_002869 [Candidatus Lokiarchaeum ossiferum]|uniref:Uncharacterized protein n=1 Tax=Candidatus Lokiarchaeum ossiferum TaxID=2951803 RepID=A0ABY6HSV2_9ARCH|nr:hypothetical protein NEF87_002869 [Candidatus Lokiarchaeum sp. B-35]